MLKKILTISVFTLAICAMVQAQSKERMYVKAFTKGASVSAENCEKVRAAVFSAVNVSGRFDLLDAFAENSIEQEREKRKSEEAMNDNSSRQQVEAVKGNDYIMDGDVSALEVKSEVKDGKTIYTCSFNYSVTITDFINNTTVATKSFSYSGSSLGGFLGDLTNYDSPEKAINGALSTIEKEIKNFIIEEFPLWGTVIGEDIEVKKDKLVQCYIDLGSNVGITDGQMFIVYEVQKKAGKDIKKEMGRLKAIEVNEEITLCKVSKGDKELKLAMDRYLENKALDENAKPLIVKSDIKRGIGGFFE